MKWILAPLLLPQLLLAQLQQNPSRGKPATLASLLVPKVSTSRAAVLLFVCLFVLQFIHRPITSSPALPSRSMAHPPSHTVLTPATVRWDGCHSLSAFDPHQASCSTTVSPHLCNSTATKTTTQCGPVSCSRSQCRLQMWRCLSCNLTSAARKEGQATPPQ